MNCGSLHAFVTLNWVKVLYILAARDTIAMGLTMFIVLKAAVVSEWILPITIYLFSASKFSLIGCLPPSHTMISSDMTGDARGLHVW